MGLVTDLRHALRVLRQTAGFGLVRALLLRPLPYEDPARRVTVWEDASAAGFRRKTPARANCPDWRAMKRAFADMAATRTAGDTLTGDGPPELLAGRGVTP